MKKFSIYTSGLNKNAFTLAEVLITLGIIGIVAAITQNTSCAYYALTDTHPTKPGKITGRIFSAKFMADSID